MPRPCLSTNIGVAIPMRRVVTSVVAVLFLLLTACSPTLTALSTITPRPQAKARPANLSVASDARPTVTASVNEAAPRATPVPATPAAVANPAPDSSLIIIQEPTLLEVVDPSNGRVAWKTTIPSDSHPNIVAGRRGLVYFSLISPDRSRTDVFALPLYRPAEVPVGHVAGAAVLMGLATSGDRLSLVRFGQGLETTPSELIELPIAAQWQGPSPGVLNQRDLGLGLLTWERQWYHLATSGPSSQTDRTSWSATLQRVAFPASGSSPVLSSLPIPAQATYFSLLPATDGHTLYVVDYDSAVLNPDLHLPDTLSGPQTIYKVDVDRRTIVDWSVFRHVGTKASACAATLSPDGQRLFIAAREGFSGDGIDVIDTNSLARVGHFLPGRSFECVAVDPNGRWLHASTGHEIIAIDLSTGTERTRIQINSDDALPTIAMAVQRP